MAEFAHIVSVGARTPLGLQAAASAAAFRAGISGVGVHPFMTDRLGDPMPIALDRGLDSELMGPERLLALAESALREACFPLSDLPGARLRVPLYLSLPELRPGFSDQDAETIRSGLARLVGLPVDLSEVRGMTEGHAAGLSALSLAAEQIQSGRMEACLIGGVDSYFQPETMEWLEANRQLTTADAPSAFIPGEGAGACLVVSERLRQRLGVSAKGRVLSASVGRETKRIKTPEVCLGEGLTATIQRALARLPAPAQLIDNVICDINGERYRGEEWGFVCLRLPRYFRSPTAYQSPASLWGDMGAASGPLFAMLACQAAERGYAQGARTMLWAGSEGGQRAAAVLELDSSSQGKERGAYV